MKENYDVIIVGTGAAGLYCALNLPSRMKVLMLTKQQADQSDSFLAQGGICMLRGEEDYNDYFEDTMRAGHYENDAKAVELMIRSSNSIIRDLLQRNVTFERTETGELDFTREGAHSQPRILFYEDITGKQITQTLLNQALTRDNIEICEYMTMVDIISKDNVCGGVIVMDEKNEVYPVRAPYVCSGMWWSRRSLQKLHQLPAYCRRWTWNRHETSGGTRTSGLYTDSSDYSLFS